MRYAPEFLDELRRGIRLSELVGRRVALKRSGRELVGLCPFHREKTPSFTVRDDKRFFHCFGCGAHGDAIGFVMRADNVDFRAAVATLAGGLGKFASVAPSVDSAPAIVIDPRNKNRAWRLWQDAAPARGSPVEKYLRIRGVPLPPQPVLRYARHCWHREIGDDRLPAMLARVDDADGNFLAVHRTWLEPDGSGKAALRDSKMSLGPIKGGAIRLAPAGPLLAIAEGIETAMAVITAKRIPAWSAVSKSGFKTLRLPDEVREVLIVADHDANGGGELAARQAGERWASEGHLARLWRSARVGEDANNLLLEPGEKDDVARRPRERA